jgi:hypothetical protein
VELFNSNFRTVGHIEGLVRHAGREQQKFCTLTVIPGPFYRCSSYSMCFFLTVRFIVSVQKELLANDVEERELRTSWFQASAAL